jgi:hypothetical protein
VRHFFAILKPCVGGGCLGAAAYGAWLDAVTR